MQMEKNDYVDDLKSELKEVKALLHVSIPIFQKKIRMWLLSPSLLCILLLKLLSN